MFHHSDSIFSLRVPPAGTLTLAKKCKSVEIFEEEEELVSIYEPWALRTVDLANIPELFFY